MDAIPFLPIGMTLCCGWFIVEGFATGTVVALPVRFERDRQPKGFWFCMLFYGFMLAITWAAWLSERGVL